MILVCTKPVLVCFKMHAWKCLLQVHINALIFVGSIECSVRWD